MRASQGRKSRLLGPGDDAMYIGFAVLWRLSTSVRAFRSPVTLVAFIVAGCIDFTGPSRDTVRVRVAASPHARVLDVTLSSPDGIVVLYQATEADPLVIDVPAARRRHRIRLARLRADAVYQVEVRRRWVERPVGPPTLSFRTDPLPADLAQLKFTTEGDLSAPLVLLEITSNQGGFEGLISVDEA